MSSISAVGMNHSYQDYGKFASGKKIQSAADAAVAAPAEEAAPVEETPAE